MITKFFHHQEYVTKTIFIPNKKERNLKVIQEQILTNKIEYPFICKPDRGHRGNGFKIIKTLPDLAEYSEVCERAFLIQEYIEYPLEYGIFWIKVPNEEYGKITSIMRKTLPYLKGNGNSTLSELILQDPRAKFMAKAYFEKNKNHLDSVIAANTMYRICSAGNHCQGAIFEDGVNDIRGNTLQKLEEICSSVKGYDFGRMDIKFKDIDSLSSGKDFKILEVNGSEAESTHIYDRKYSLLYAYKTLYQQWDTLFKITKLNRINGFLGLATPKLITEYIDFFKENKVIPSD